MLSRSTCIVALILLCGQILLAGVLPVPTLAPLHPAWLLQDHLRTQIRQGAQQPWPFRPGHRSRALRKRGPRPQPLASPVARMETEVTQPPETWPDQVTALMDQEACRRLIQQVRWEEGLVCPHCGSSQVEVLRGQLTSAGWQRYACRRCRTPRGYPRTFSDLTGTPWEGSHLSPAQLVVSLAAFVEGHSAEEMARQMGTRPRIGQRTRRLYQVVCSTCTVPTSLWKG